MLYMFVCLLFVLGTTAQSPAYHKLIQELFHGENGTGCCETGLCFNNEPCEANISELNCDLPPPKIPNGDIQVLNYQVVKGRPIYSGQFNETNYPDKKVYSYDARMNCNPGFNLVGFNDITCLNGVIEDMPACVSICEKRPDIPGVLSCGMGFNNFESKCMVPKEGIAGFAGSANAPSCGRLASGSLVVNGKPAKYGDVPWHVGIYSKTTRPFMQVCGGTLVRSNVVISAAHCFWSDIEKKLPAENFAVAAGKIYRPWNNANETSSARKSDVSEIRIPPRYRGGATNFQDDLAVLLLTTPLQVDNVNVVLACLDFENTLDEKHLQDGTIGTVAGWGLTGADGPASQILNIVKLPMVDIDRCINQAEPSFLSSITSDKICAGYTNGTTVCRGDSGGGLAVPEKDEQGDQYFLRGIVSTAPKSDHLCNVYAVATFTHVAKHRHFINAVISGAPEIPAEAPSFSGVIDQQSPVSVQLTDPLNTGINPGLNTDINTGVNTDLNTDINTGVNTDVNSDVNTGTNPGVTSDINTGVNTDLDTGVNTDLDTGVNTDLDTGVNTGIISDKNGDININANDESGIRPANVDNGFVMILPVTKSPDEANVEQATVSYNERNFCTTVCRGDSGGGLAIPENDVEGDQYFLRGIVSTAPKSDHLCNVFAVATFTQINKHEFFIKAAISAAPVVAETKPSFSGVIEDTRTTTNKPVTVVNPLNTDLNPLNTNTTDKFGDKFNETDSLDINTAITNTNVNIPVSKPVNQPTEESVNTDGTDVETDVTDANIAVNKPTGIPPILWVNDKEKPLVNTDVNMDLSPELFTELYPNWNPNATVDIKPVINPAVNTDINSNVTDKISDKANKTDTLDINTAITNAPPSNNNWDVQKPLTNQEKTNNTYIDVSIIPTVVSGTTVVTEPTATVFKPMVSDLLPVNLDLNPPKTEAPETKPISFAPSGPVSSSDTPTSSGTLGQNPVLSGNADLIPESKPVSSVPSGAGVIHDKPNLTQGTPPFTERPGHDYNPPHHHQNNPVYNDWKDWHNNYHYWHNNPHNWNNYHHNCHEHGHDYHQNWHYQYWQNYHDEWQNYHQDKDKHQNWPNFHHDWQMNYQNRPNNQQNWQNDYQNTHNYHQNWPNYNQNMHKNEQQNWHNFLVKNWQSQSDTGYNTDLSQQNKPVVHKNGYSGYGK